MKMTSRDITIWVTLALIYRIQSLPLPTSVKEAFGPQRPTYEEYLQICSTSSDKVLRSALTRLSIEDDTLDREQRNEIRQTCGSSCFGRCGQDLMETQCTISGNDMVARFWFRGVSDVFVTSAYIQMGGGRNVRDLRKRLRKQQIQEDMYVLEMDDVIEDLSDITVSFVYIEVQMCFGCEQWYKCQLSTKVSWWPFDYNVKDVLRLWMEGRYVAYVWTYMFLLSRILLFTYVLANLYNIVDWLLRRSKVFVLFVGGVFFLLFFLFICPLYEMRLVNDWLSV
ncbi:membrane protein S13 [Saimiriine betaherpesvirus 4]|uniref:Membrane protein S13 n=1 Tax=Saimiriine betaherpesvirus 4 TaxID=1535247 RepID=G8XT34_9BETA|nr:membrane protein S13 [Saimiriine betaherpesvirus 4]AEV80985.1 membrane protein S13 [Saimiriine betaherpesvirus 4]